MARASRLGLAGEFDGRCARTYRLSVQVVYGEPRGPQSLLDEIQIELLRQLQAERCFLHAAPYDRAAAVAAEDLLLNVTLDGLENERDVEMTQAQELAPEQDPDDERRVVARLGARIVAQIDTLIDPTPVIWRRFAVERSHRPLLREDPVFEVRLRFVEELTRAVRVWACGTKPEKLERRLRRARERVAD